LRKREKPFRDELLKGDEKVWKSLLQRAKRPAWDNWEKAVARAKF